LGLSVRGIEQDPVYPWGPACGLLAVSVLLAGLAVWQRRDVWAFAAGFSVNVAASLILLDGHRPDDWRAWGVPRVESNVLICAGVAALWLSARGAPQRSPLLHLQVGLAVLGIVVVLAHAAYALIAEPDVLDAVVVHVGQGWSWLAFAGTLFVFAWGFRWLLSRIAVQVLCTAGLSLGVLAACTASAWDQGQWLAYHVLMIGWAVCGLTAMGSAWLGAGEQTGDDGSTLSEVQVWVGIFAALVFGLAVRGAWQDPTGVSWSAAALLAVSVMAGGMALRQGREEWAFLAGLGVNLAVSLFVWEAHQT